MPRVVIDRCFEKKYGIPKSAMRPDKGKENRRINDNTGRRTGTKECN